MATEACALDRDFNTETLQVDDDGEDDDGRDKVHDVGETITPERFTEGTALVVPGEEEVEKSDDGALKLGAATNVDSGGGEGLPYDGLANVGSNEQVDTRAQAVALLEELVEEDDDEGRNNELDDEEKADTGSEVFGLAIETGEDVDGGLAESNNDSKDWKWLSDTDTCEDVLTRTLLSPTEQRTILLERKIDVNQVGTSEKLHDHSGRDDWGDTELHECTAVGRKNDAHPVQRVGRVGGHDSVQWDLRAYQEDEERHRRP